ncbi:hypothetical protein ACHWQZ_G015025 [Mnemiopsis leidyi]
MADCKRGSICLQSNGSASESDSEIEMDKEFLIGTLPSTTETLIQDMKMDPRLEVSDHDSDQELSMHGYGSCDTDATDEDETSHLESRLFSKDWCRCGNCEEEEEEGVCLKFDGEVIPNVSEKPIKFLGRWIRADGKDKVVIEETEHEVDLYTLLKRLDECSLSGLQKCWGYQYMVLPKMKWPLDPPSTIFP